MSIEIWSSLFIGGILLVMVSFVPDTEQAVERQSITNYDWRVVRIFPHDSDAFTQGLIFRDGFFYESTGRRGKSSVRKVCPDTGEILLQMDLNDEYFAEGLTDWNDQLIQLTLSSEVGFIYEIDSFINTGKFKYTGEGWGLTHNGEHLIISNGTEVLRFLDPNTFEEIKQVTVTENGKEVSKLNELEMIKGKIYANVLFRDDILEIDPESGNVTGRINLEALVTKAEKEADVNVLNGIAYDEEGDRIFVTGKLWPNIYEIKIWERY